MIGANQATTVRVPKGFSGLFLTPFLIGLSGNKKAPKSNQGGLAEILYAPPNTTPENA
jgi:hypothetical protein